MFCCLTASTAGALLCVANVEFGIQVIAEAVVTCPEEDKLHSTLGVKGMQNEKPVVWYLYLGITDNTSQNMLWP